MNPEQRQQLIDASPGVKYNRREVIFRMVPASILGLLGLVALGDEGITAVDVYLAEQEAEAAVPLLDSETLQRVEQFDKLSNTIFQLANDKQFDQLATVLNSPEFKLASEAHHESLVRKGEVERIYGTIPRKNTLSRDHYWETLAATFGVMGTAAGLFFSVDKPLYQARRQKASAEKMIDTLSKSFHFDEDDKTLRNLMRAATILPPIGGKIPLVVNEKKERLSDHMLSPVYFAEAQAADLVLKRRKGSLGSIYLHQMTVQGQLPDSFKMAAYALLCNSPFIADWNTSFFTNRAWEQMQPLIHDSNHAGFTDTTINPIWSKVKGRTDFLQRVSAVRFEDTEDVNSLIDAALFNKFEEQRIIQETSFYQRTALACHAHGGTAPKKIPKIIRGKLEDLWRTFDGSMKELMGDYGMSDLLQVPWFLPRPLYHPAMASYGKRYEADYRPIQRALIEMEEVRSQHPEIRPQVSRIITATSGAVDEVIEMPVLTFQM